MGLSTRVSSCWWNPGIMGDEQKNECSQDKENNAEMSSVNRRWIFINRKQPHWQKVRRSEPNKRTRMQQLRVQPLWCRFNSWEGRDGYLREKTSTGKTKKTLSTEAAHVHWSTGKILGWGQACHCLSASLLFLSNSELSSEFPDFSSVPEVNLDLKEVFNKAWAMSLPPHRSSTYSIELLPGARILSPLSLSQREKP